MPARTPAFIFCSRGYCALEDACTCKSWAYHTASKYDQYYKRSIHNICRDYPSALMAGGGPLHMLSIVLGGWHFVSAGGQLNMYVLVSIHKVYTWYIRYGYGTCSAARKRSKNRKWRPQTAMISRREGTWQHSCAFFAICQPWFWISYDVPLLNSSLGHRLTGGGGVRRQPSTL